MNQKRYWLRGAIIATIYGIVAVIVTHLFFRVGDNYSTLSLFLYPFIFIGSPINFIIILISPITKILPPFWGGIYFSIVYCFPVGALTGLLYGKIKNRNQ